MDKMRTFDSGATRNVDDEKLDLEGFLSPLVLHRYAEYLNKHRTQADGKFRDSDNWQKGIPLAVYMKSGFRHFFGWWANHRHVGDVVKENIEESLCGLLFNVMGYLHEHLKDKAGDYNAVEIDGPIPEFKVNDAVKIVLRDNSFLYKRVMEAGNIGVYKWFDNAATYPHFIQINVNGAPQTWGFHSNEIFPVEDN
ncbi:hypothetical protein LCGC14_0653320 [marine sediment metagenome]|uniref:dATP/dGTP diphosphohydrolase N-terminal domain-containing protein n=1 Tax=marine sediment metagenome TaxID=412755 RepID=A0A0F9QVP0_9ZZZZ